MLSDQKACEIVGAALAANPGKPDAACYALCTAAHNAESEDNISASILMCTAPPTAANAAPAPAPISSPAPALVPAVVPAPAPVSAPAPVPAAAELAAAQAPAPAAPPDAAAAAAPATRGGRRVLSVTRRSPP